MPSSPKVVYMGVAADCTYTQRYGSQTNATQQILNNWNSASALYRNTFRISLGIVELQVMDSNCPTATDPAVPWNIDCGSVTLNDRLSLFSQWRGTREQMAPASGIFCRDVRLVLKWALPGWQLVRTLLHGPCVVIHQSIGVGAR
jgi:hypothetical protein